MKRKGFTLIELLAVIVILAVIGLITIPLIGNIIEDSKKKALEQSVNGIVEAANYFAISNEGIHKFVFKDEVQGKTEEGDYSLDYKGSVNATGELYIDNDGNISLCLMNDDYYVYKNYNSGIYIGNIKDDTCIIDYDALTNKYVAMLDDGTGEVSNVYSRDDVDSLVTNLQEQITTNKNSIDSITSMVDTNTANIVSLQNAVTEINNKFSYSSILDKITTGTAPITIYSAYVENGVVVINAAIDPTSAGDYYAQINDSSYYPRSTAVGSFYYQTSSDVGAVNSIYIGSNGKIAVWTNKANTYGIGFTVTYPLKTS